MSTHDRFGGSQEDNGAGRLGHGGQVSSQHRRRGGLRRLHPAVHRPPAFGVHAHRHQKERHQVRKRLRRNAPAPDRHCGQRQVWIGLLQRLGA